LYFFFYAFTGQLHLSEYIIWHFKEDEEDARLRLVSYSSQYHYQIKKQEAFLWVCPALNK
jgi:hypothetical protein